MRMDERTRSRLRLQGATSTVLLVAVAGLLAYLSTVYKVEADWTSGARRSLSPASVQVLHALEGPVTVTAFAREGSQTRPVIRELLARYRRAAPGRIRLQFVDPDAAPQRAREEGITSDGELILSYQGRKERVRSFELDEQSVTNALQRLLRSGRRKLVFLTGHGERDPHGQANRDYAGWVRELERKGFRVETLNLADTPAVPQDATAVVVADPQVDLLPGEVGILRDWVRRGGRLLWLHDPGPLHGLEPLARELGVQFLPGVVIDLTTQLLGIRSPTVAVVTRYPDSEITRDFALLTVFPHAAALQADPPKGRWRAVAFLRTEAGSWAESGPLKGEVRFDEGKDVRGPLTLGVALEPVAASSGEAEETQGAGKAAGGGRPEAAKAGAAKGGAEDGGGPGKAEGKAQGGGHGQAGAQAGRVVVVGDGDFLSNTYLANGGNLDLGVRIANWLAGDVKLLSIPPRTAPDVSLALTSTQATLIGFGFLAGLPALLLGTGLTLWWRRRRR
ncbi:MAG: ABC transporter [Gammaproteobacteria bacterium]|nr:MAG: ABC transporter [Gammaproteobacteria bacterium]